MHFTKVTALTTLALAPGALAHGFIRSWGLKGGNLEAAQKTDLKSSAFRAASDNTGWIGSNFATGKGITCGASNTPGGTVSAPSGVFFSDADQSAGRELSVSPGDTLTLVVAGNPGEGWPHRNGHIQTYLGSCNGDCTNFDAATTDYSKIQEEDKGIQSTLIPAYDSGLDGNPYDVKLPDDLAGGSYILRFELISHGQSSAAEDNQAQIYPFCGQIKVGGGNNKAKRTIMLSRRQTVRFPQAYANADLFDTEKAPGPNVADSVTSGSSSSSTSSNNSTTSSSGKKSSGKASTSSASNSNTVPSSSLSLGSSAPQCATMCLRVKISEASSLASSCTGNDASCLCGSSTFVEAFTNCAKDNCDGDDDAAVQALTSACGSGSEKRDLLAGSQRRVKNSRRSTAKTVKRNSMKMHKKRRAVGNGDVKVKGFHH